MLVLVVEGRQQGVCLLGPSVDLTAEEPTLGARKLASRIPQATRSCAFFCGDEHDFYTKSLLSSDPT